MMNTNLRILISGGGISGLCAALRLHAKGFHNLTICERTKDVDLGGFGLNLQPHACQVLHELNLLEEVSSLSWSPTDERYYTFDGRLVATSPCGLLDMKDFPQTSIHRGLLIAVLEKAVRERLGGKALMRGLEVTAYSQTAADVSLRLVDHASQGKESTLVGDLLIVADGQQSALRKQMVGKDDGPPVRSGLSLFRAVVPHNAMLEGHSVLVAGDSKAKLVCYPISKPFHTTDVPSGSCDAATIADCCQGASDFPPIQEDVSVRQCMNVIVAVPEAESDAATRARVPAEDVLSRLEAASAGRLELPFLDYREMLRSARELAVWPMVDSDPLARIVEGKVVLVGDSAHPMFVEGSSGASAAVQGAALLGDCMWKHLGGTVEEALLAYQETFLPAVTRIQLACREAAADKVMDRVHAQVPWGAEVPEELSDDLLQSVGTVHSQCLLSTEHLLKRRFSQPSLVTRSITSRLLVSTLSPLERILVMANSTLQAVMSAYTNDDIVVVPQHTIPRRVAQDTCYDRLVHLRVGSKRGPVIARCSSVVFPRSERIAAMIRNKSAGIGQLFALNSVPPAFHLICVGKFCREQRSPISTPRSPPNHELPPPSSAQVLTRQYVLDSEELRCLIYEEIDLETLMHGETPSATSSQLGAATCAATKASSDDGGGVSPVRVEQAQAESLDHPAANSKKRCRPA